jgi:hypothetical protein
VAENALRVTVPFTPFTDPAGITAAGSGEVRRLITSAAQYKYLFGHAAPADVNFAKGEIVVFYSAGVKNTGGYAASIASIAFNTNNGALVVTTSLSSPGPECAVTQALTHPYALAKLKKPRGLSSVRFLRANTVRKCPTPEVCGGFLGLPCPEPQTCIDDPSDDCDPKNGGADCSGICVCPKAPSCIYGTKFDKDSCSCVPDPTQDPCATVRCSAGHHCEPTSENTATCVPDAPFCGGIAGFPCPGAGTCVDDPSDSCDPDNGGADCGGLCQCNALGFCVDGFVWDGSPNVCDCVPSVNPCAATLCMVGTTCQVIDGAAVCVSNGGQACGAATCGAGYVCCNASCGMCTLPGMACIQIACN